MAERGDENVDVAPSGMVTEKTEYLSVEKVFKYKGDVVGEDKPPMETVRVRRFKVQPASVGFKMKFTVNMQDYESVSVEVSHFVPCYTEESADAYIYAHGYVRKRLIAEIDKIYKTGLPHNFPEMIYDGAEEKTIEG